MEWIASASPASIPIGSWDTLRLSELHQSGRPSHQGNPQLGGDRIVHALELLKQLDILHYRRLELVNHDGQPFSRFLIFAVDSITGFSGTVSASDRNRNQGSHLSVKQSKAALETVLLNMNVDPWIFQHESEATASGYSPTTIFQDDRTRRLIDIYLDMPSPRGSDDPFMRSDIRTPSKAAERLLQQAIERDSPRGMRTTLYDYQRKSLWKLLRRELCPDIMIDPTLIPVQDMDGVMYYINTANGGLTIGRRPSSTWDDTPGGIICEDMGTGKSCLCIALIMQTLYQSSHPPSITTQLHCDVGLRASTPVATIAQDNQIASTSGSSAIVARPTPIPTLRDLAAVAVKMSRVNYIRLQDYINPGTLELLEDTSVYYYQDGVNNGANARSNLQRAKLFKTAESTHEIFLSSTTLVIVPSNLADQWCNEVNKHTKEHALRLLRIESGLDKEIPDHKTLMKYDMVLITQTRFAKEYEPGAYSQKHIKEHHTCACSSLYIPCRCPIPRTVSPLMQIRWKRVIVDEGHSMGLKLSDHTLLAEQLHADHRWICTGTPTFNLANLKPSTVTSDHPYKSDKDDLERLGTIIRSFLHLQPYHGDKTLFSKTLVRSLEDHHRIKARASTEEWSLESLSSVARLRYLMDRIMVRNKPADVERDVKLPPLYERIVRLDLDYYQVLTINCLIALIQANAVLTEREDQDYFFHPINRKHLARVIENLKDGCFWYPGGPDYQEHLHSTLKNVQKGIEKHQATPGGKYPKEDFDLLKEIHRHLSIALGDKDWSVIQKSQEVGYYCKNLPAALQKKYALIPAREADMNLPGTNEVSMDDASGSSEQVTMKPASQESGHVCVMLAKNITKLRSDRDARGSKSHSSRRNRQQMAPLDDDIGASADASTSASGVASAGLSRETQEATDARIISSTSTKLSYIVSKILQHQSQEKSIVFCQNLTTMYYVREYLTLAKVRCLMYHTHGMTERGRSSNIMTFNTSENVAVIIMDTKHAAFGIDLSGASRVYFVSPVWQTATMRQAVKRAHRIGQTRPVYVETLIIKDSFEEVILNRRSEIDREEALGSRLGSGSGSGSVSGSSERSLSPPMHHEIKSKKKRSGGSSSGKGMVDDGKMREFISHIDFMPLPRRANATAVDNMEAGLAEVSYSSMDDFLAFHEPDTARKALSEVPVVFPDRTGASASHVDEQQIQDLELHDAQAVEVLDYDLEQPFERDLICISDDDDDDDDDAASRDVDNHEDHKDMDIDDGDDRPRDRDDPTQIALVETHERLNQLSLQHGWSPDVGSSSSSATMTIRHNTMWQEDEDKKKGKDVKFEMGDSKEGVYLKYEMDDCKEEKDLKIKMDDSKDGIDLKFKMEDNKDDIDLKFKLEDCKDGIDLKVKLEDIKEDLDSKHGIFLKSETDDSKQGIRLKFEVDVDRKDLKMEHDDTKEHLDMKIKMDDDDFKDATLLAFDHTSEDVKHPLDEKVKKEEPIWDVNGYGPESTAPKVEENRTPLRSVMTKHNGVLTKRPPSSGTREEMEPQAESSKKRVRFA